MGELRWVGGAFVFIFWRLNTPRIIQAQKNNYLTDKLEMLSGGINLSGMYQADLGTERERQMTGKHTERTKRDFWCSICLSLIGHSSCLICVHCHQLTFPFCCYISLLSQAAQM